MTSPAWVWVARIELAFSRFQTERSTIEPHPCTGPGGRGRTFVARFKAACPTFGRLRNIGCCGRSRTFARGLMRPGILRGAQRCKRKAVTRKEETLPAALPLSYRRAEPDERESSPRPIACE